MGKCENGGVPGRRGERGGMAGLVGGGRTAVAKAIFGMDKRATGKIFIKGKPMALGNVNRSMKHRIGYLPEDRKKEGLVLSMNISDNVSLPHIDTFSRFGFVVHGREIQEVERLTKLLRVEAPSIDP